MVQVALKIKDDAGNPVNILVDTDKLHETWTARCLAYGIRRLINDTNSAAKGKVKVDACNLMAGEMMAGKPAPERLASGVSVDPITALAVKNAKADLGAIFRQVTGATIAKDWLAHDDTAKFFKATDAGKAVWRDDVVVKWVAAQIDETDYMAQAKKLLDPDNDKIKAKLNITL